jgi:hypothetical protein
VKVNNDATLDKVNTLKAAENAKKAQEYIELLETTP